MSYQDSGETLPRPDPPIFFSDTKPGRDFIDYRPVVFGRGERKSVDPANKVPDIFKDVFETTIQYLTAEEASDLAQDAVMQYLENVGLTRPVDSSEYDGMTVKVSNVDEIATAIIQGWIPKKKPNTSADKLQESVS